MSLREARMRTKSEESPLEWRVLAIADKDPLAFAKNLQQTLQELTDQQYNVTSQIRLGDSLIIIANKLNQISSMATSTTLPPPAQESIIRRRIVEQPRAVRHGSTTDEVIYHYKEFSTLFPQGIQQQKTFSNLVDALRLVREHLKTEGFLPINIVTATLTYFDFEAFKGLFDTFAEDLEN